MIQQSTHKSTKMLYTYSIHIYVPDLINFVLDNTGDIKSSFVDILDGNVLFFTIDTNTSIALHYTPHAKYILNSS